MGRCMFCKRNREIFIISVVCGEPPFLIKNIILELFKLADEHLTNNRGICGTCLYLLNTVLNWKNFLFHCIRQEDTEESYNLNFDKFHSNYQTFVHNLLSAKFVDNNEKERNNDSLQSHDDIGLSKDQESNSRKSSVSIEEEDDSPEASQSSPDLLTPMYSVPYIDVKKNKRRLYNLDALNPDDEVKNVFNARRRKKRKKKAEIWTRRKGSAKRCHSAFTVISRNYSRAEGTPYSTYSLDSRYTYDESLSDYNETYIRPQNTASHVTNPSYECISGCKETFTDLIELTQHKIDDHKLLAKYWCYECHCLKFTSKEDLNQHKNLFHHTLLSNCFLCSSKFTNLYDLHSHMSKHKRHTVDCEYCDLSFLSRVACGDHIKECHKGQKEPKRLPRHIIIDRIDVKEHVEEPSTNKLGEFIMKELIQNNKANIDEDENLTQNSKTENNSSNTSIADHIEQFSPLSLITNEYPDDISLPDLMEPNIEIADIEYEIQIKSNVKIQSPILQTIIRKPNLIQNNKKISNKVDIKNKFKSSTHSENSTTGQNSKSQTFSFEDDVFL